jgi:hypothetical protein
MHKRGHRIGVTMRRNKCNFMFYLEIYETATRLRRTVEQGLRMEIA